MIELSEKKNNSNNNNENPSTHCVLTVANCPSTRGALGLLVICIIYIILSFNAPCMTRVYCVYIIPVSEKGL